MDEHNQQQRPPMLDWEQKILEKLVFAALNEQKASRRWGIFFKVLVFAYAAVVLGLVGFSEFDKGTVSHKPHVAVVDVQGVIGTGEGVSAETVNQGLRDALEDNNTKAIFLNINSPGGSPVQSALIYDEIRRLKKAHPQMPIYAVVGDLCASGGYYVASAADKIFVNQASLIGSIGVVMNGFGFTQAMDKLGVERRVMTAGAHKALLDPFSPVSAMEKNHVQAMLDQVHQQFIGAVKQGRGERLKETPDMFSGLIWTGAESVELGLADDFGSVDSIAREQFATDQIENFTPKEQLLDRLAGRFGASFGHALGTLMGVGMSSRYGM
jgi:protease IV